VLALGGSSENTVEVVAGRWAQAAAITSVTLIEGVGDEYVVGSEFLLGVVDERYLVEEIEDAAADFAVAFNSIPQGEGDLVLVGYPRSDVAAVEDEVLHKFNGDDTAANYPSQELTGIGAATGAASPVNQEIGMISGDNATALVFGALLASYSQYAKQNQPHYLSLSGYHENTGATGHVRVMSGRRDNVEPISRLGLTPNAGERPNIALLGRILEINEISEGNLFAMIHSDGSGLSVNMPEMEEMAVLKRKIANAVMAFYSGITDVFGLWIGVEYRIEEEPPSIAFSDQGRGDEASC